MWRLTALISSQNRANRRARRAHRLSGKVQLSDKGRGDGRPPSCLMVLDGWATAVDTECRSVYPDNLAYQSCKNVDSIIPSARESTRQTEEESMKRLGHFGTRRQLFRAMAAGAASVPFLALGKKSAAAACTTPSTTARGCSCLLKGTKISTPSGDRPVQELQIGDEVYTLAGRKAIKWIGYQKFTKEEDRAWQKRVMPIRVARFAIDDHSPHSDLYLSPLHCIFFNEALIPVKYLINGTSVAQGMPSDMSAIEYYHIEFDTHEVLFAEGVLVESFFEEGLERENFSNFAQYKRLYGAERQPKMTPFAPILGYRNRRQKIQGLARSLVSNVVDLRDPIQIAYDQIARQAEAMLV
jgi:Hint domain